MCKEKTFEELVEESIVRRSYRYYGEYGYDCDNRQIYFKSYDNYKYWKEYGINNISHCKDSYGRNYYCDKDGRWLTKEEYDKLCNLYNENISIYKKCMDIIIKGANKYGFSINSFIKLLK